ncbi:MAG: DUF3048 domain-containing protein [Bacillota bacterium]
MLLNKRKSVWRTSILSISMVLMLSACSGEKKEEPVVTPEAQTPVETPAETPPGKETAAFTAPLTGMPLEEASNRRPLSVMINNAPAARPQSGLSQADIVYEVLAEGGITRLIAIFQSQTGIEKIGPIRSIRPYLINIGESYGGVLVHAGGSPEAYSIIKKQGKQDLDEIGNAGAYFWREKDRKAPHNLYSSDEKLREGADKHKFSGDVTIPKYTFMKEEAAEPGSDSGSVSPEAAEPSSDSGSISAEVAEPDSDSGSISAEAAEPDSDSGSVSADVPAGEAAAKVDITFLLKNYVVGYTYDEQSKLYQRSINGQPHIDLNNNSALTAANVIVLGANHKVLDDVGRLAVDIDPGGEAMLFQQGKVIKGQWVRSAGDVIRFMKDGKEVPLVPGTTYFNIVPNTPAFDTHITITNP